MAINTTTQIDVEQALRDDLSQYLCGNVWNYPLSELRRNITLRAISRGICTKYICDIGSTYVELPNAKYNGQAHEYYVYAAACCCMGGLVVDCEQSDVLQLMHYGDWVRLDQYLNIRPFDLRIHSVHGEWLNRNRIFIKNHPTEDMFLIAIDARMADKLLGVDYNFSTVYMSVYYDSDNDLNNLHASSPRIHSVYIETQEDINDMYSEYLINDHDKTFFFINGRLSTPSSLLDITVGDYVEFVYDPDIVANIVLDMINDRDNHLYRSKIDGTYKYIIHIPKSKNPNNYIITHNTCDVFISPLNTAPIDRTNLNGLFVHRFDTSYREYQYVETTDTVYRKGRTYYQYSTVENRFVKKTLTDEDYGKPIQGHLYVVATEYLSDHLITQITHNDFGVSEKLLQPYMDIIGSTECSLRIVVRRHNKSNRLDRDCNFLKFLYQFDDETILNFLNGNLQTYCPFWKAEELEQSEWIKVLFELPRNIYEESTEHYINALGYYNSACIITPRVVYGAFNPQNTYALDFTIPRSLQSGKGLDSVFSVNGKVLRRTDYNDIKENQYLHFSINNNVNLNTGDKLVAEMFEKKRVRAEYFTPTRNAASFVIPEDSVDLDFDLYLVKDNCTIASDYFVDHYVDQTNLKGYQKIADKNEYISTINDTYRNETVDSVCVDSGCTNPDHHNTQIVKILTQREVVFNSNAYNKKIFIVSKAIYNRFTEEDMELSGGNTQLSTLHNPNDSTRTCTDLLHTGKLLISGRKWRSDELITFPIIDSSLSIIPFCNGRELIKDVDYSEITLKDNSNYVAYRTFLFAVSGLGASESTNDSDYYENDSYLKYDNNEFDLIVTDDKLFTRLNGFALSDEMYDPGSINARLNTITIDDMVTMVYWFNELNKLVVDGKTIYLPANVNGRLQFAGPHRNGALYGSRGVIPSKTIQFINKYKDNIEDVEKLTKIVNYVRSLAPDGDLGITVINHSHHITSITTNCLVKDVITGAKDLSWTEAQNAIDDMVAEYRDLAKYDPALSGAVKDIFVTLAGTAIVNDRYHQTDITAIGNNRVWENTNHRCTIAYNSNLSRWELLVNTILGVKVYYYATSNNANDPWNLGWMKDVGDAPMPVIRNDGLDGKFLDIAPSYTSDIHEVEEDIMLRRCIAALLPADTTKDGATTL